MPVATDPRFVPQAFPDGLSQANTDVFCGMVGIDVQVTGALDFQVDQCMTREQNQHVVQEADTRLDRVFACPIEIQPQFDLRLVGLAF
jgi:hypothetical protein